MTMADDKSGRDKQADDDDRRQRKRDIIEALEREDETEPPVDDTDIDTLTDDLEPLAFPATGAEVVAAIGDREIESADGSYRIEELVPDTDAEQFDSPVDVHVRVVRPTVAAAMKEIVEASETLPNAELKGSQRKSYEKTLRALRSIDADDEDEGIQAITDWIVERIRDKEKLPGSRSVRREAAKFCRANGYQVRNDEWLGV